jgi:hypothetical protein
MPEAGKSPTPRAGFPFFLGKRKERVSHIPTARLLLLVYYTERKGDIFNEVR